MLKGFKILHRLLGKTKGCTITLVRKIVGGWVRLQLRDQVIQADAN